MRKILKNHTAMAGFRTVLLGFTYVAAWALQLFCQVQAGDVEVPTIDLDNREDLQVIVDRQPGQYLGHPTTLLLEDGHTILCVYPKGHGKGAILYKRSTDGGKTWSDHLPTPKSWETSKETPTIHRVVTADGKKRILLFSGLYPVRQAISDDDGMTWSELEPIGDFGGIVTMASVVPILSKPGHYTALFHDDSRFIHAKPNPVRSRFTLYQTTTLDAGDHWSAPAPIFVSSDVHLCEPGAVFSPDKKQIAVLLR
ncbi:MAG: exo-alpha-sialidase, partial [Pirellula sp.]